MGDVDWGHRPLAAMTDAATAFHFHGRKRVDGIA